MHCQPSWCFLSPLPSLALLVFAGFVLADSWCPACQLIRQAGRRGPAADPRWPPMGAGAFDERGNKLFISRMLQLLKDVASPELLRLLCSGTRGMVQNSTNDAWFRWTKSLENSEQKWILHLRRPTSTSWLNFTNPKTFLLNGRWIRYITYQKIRKVTTVITVNQINFLAQR